MSKGHPYSLQRVRVFANAGTGVVHGPVRGTQYHVAPCGIHRGWLPTPPKWSLLQDVVWRFRVDAGEAVSDALARMIRDRGKDPCGRCFRRPLA